MQLSHAHMPVLFILRIRVKCLLPGWEFDDLRAFWRGKTVKNSHFLRFEGENVKERLKTGLDAWPGAQDPFFEQNQPLPFNKKTSTDMHTLRDQACRSPLQLPAAVPIVLSACKNSHSVPLRPPVMPPRMPALLSPGWPP